MTTNKKLLQFLAITAVSSSVTSAFACAICTSNLSYNMARFSVIWFGIFILWLAVLWIWRGFQQSDSTVAPTFKVYVRAFSRYAIVLILLGVVMGAHLGVVMFFPLVLLTQWVKHSGSIRASEIKLWKQLKYANIIVIALLLLVIPAGHYLPPVVSEVETRQRQQEALNGMRKVLGAEEREIAAARALDPFNYETFDVPVYKVLMQGMLFYRPREPAGYKVANTNDKTIVYSRGPNGVFDLSPDIISQAMEETSDTAKLAPYTYDATNGMVGTSGDIWVAR